MFREETFHVKKQKTFRKISKPLFAEDLFTYDQRINFKGKNIVLSDPRKIENIFNYHLANLGKHFCYSRIKTN